MIYNNFAEMYFSLLCKVYTAFDNILAPRGLKIKECQNVLSVLQNPLSNLFQCNARPFPLKYLAGELWWYFTGRNDLKFINNYSSFWQKIANNDGTVNSAYGHLLFKESPNEWNWSYLSLIHDHDSRQAILHFNKPHHMIFGVRDFPCTLNGIFQIRDNKLNFTINMRSQDMVKGLTFDLPFFSVLQQCMLRLLQEQYYNLKIGTLTMFVNSLHIYESDFELTRKIIVNHQMDIAELPYLKNSLVDQHGNFKPVETDPFYQWLNEKLNGGFNEDKKIS